MLRDELLNHSQVVIGRTGERKMLNLGVDRLHIIAPLELQTPKGMLHYAAGLPQHWF